MDRALPPKLSDAFFNHPSVEEAYKDAWPSDHAEMAALTAEARRLIKSGDLPADYSPEDYANDFMGRV